jgi:hypothetical protein
MDLAAKRIHSLWTSLSLQLTSLGIAPQFVTFTHVTMESEKYICVRETSPQNSVVIIDTAMPTQPLRRPITADSALMNPNARILALKGAQIYHLPGCHEPYPPSLGIFERMSSNYVP